MQLEPKNPQSNEKLRRVLYTHGNQGSSLGWGLTVGLCYIPLHSVAPGPNTSSPCTPARTHIHTHCPLGTSVWIHCCFIWGYIWNMYGKTVLMKCLIYPDRGWGQKNYFLSLNSDISAHRAALAESQGSFLYPECCYKQNLTLFRIQNSLYI